MRPSCQIDERAIRTDKDVLGAQVGKLPLFWWNDFFAEGGGEEFKPDEATSPADGAYTRIAQSQSAFSPSYVKN
jgi:hypothetical protein